MLLLGIDLETTGLDVETVDVIELGAVLWDTERESPVMIYNELIQTTQEITPEITDITGITPQDLEFYGVKFHHAAISFLQLVKKADYLVAHNGNMFDRPILENNIRRAGLEIPAWDRWLDTTLDVDFPTKTRKLEHLAAEHKFINPFSHRAFADVLTMLKVLSHYDIQKVIRNSQQPIVTMQAICKKPWEDPAPDGQKEVDLARSSGFRWNANRKQWLKQARLEDAERDKDTYSFAVKIWEDE